MEEIKITMDRYEELIVAEHVCEIIQRYLAEDHYINVSDLKKILGVKKEVE